MLLTLPRQHLVQLYLYVLTALLLFAGHQVSRSVLSMALNTQKILNIQFGAIENIHRLFLSETAFDIKQT